MPPLDVLRRFGAKAFFSLPDEVLRSLVGVPRLSPEGWRIDTQSHALLWLVRALGEASEYTEVASARRTHASGAVVLAPRAVGPMDVADLELSLATGMRRARVYVPRGVVRPSPGLLWMHGGGFVLGSIESHDGVCRALAARAATVVVSLDYRLAPEHPFPAGVEDAVAAARWLLERGTEVGVDPGAVAIGGDSAGANLAAVAAQIVRADGRRPVAQILAYPATDATCKQPSHRAFEEGFLLTERSIQWFLDHYITDRCLAVDPGVSPLFGPDLSGLPPALVVTAGFDPLRDEGRAYAVAMKEAGCIVEHVSESGLLHGFLNMAGTLREPARALDRIAAGVRRLTRAR